MSQLVFILEEPSAREFLMNFLPEIGFLPREYECSRKFTYPGKDALLKCYANDLREWETPGNRYIVLVDKDGNDCRKLKTRILTDAEEKCRKQSGQLRARIVCRELEAWYLGDLAALRSVYPGKWKIREPGNPDEVENPKPSRFLENNIPGFDKREIPGEMGKILGRKCAESASYYGGDSAGCNRSPSFRCFVRAMREELEELKKLRP